MLYAMRPTFMKSTPELLKSALQYIFFKLMPFLTDFCPLSTTSTAMNISLLSTSINCQIIFCHLHQTAPQKQN
jgi:hypothetical protein